jgi:hypothetical protein
MAVLLIHDPAVAEALTIAEVSNTITATTSSSPISGALS